MKRECVWLLEFRTGASWGWISAFRSRRRARDGVKDWMLPDESRRQYRIRKYVPA